MKAVEAISVAFFNMQCETENIIQSFSDVINAICQDLGFHPGSLRYQFILNFSL